MRTLRLATILATFVAALALSACGDEESNSATQFVPAAGPDTPADTTPGVPEGASYDVNGNEWLKLSDQERFTAAQDYVADHPDECTNADDRSAAADPVRNWADSSIGTSYPLNVPIAELLAEGCAAALQSGEQGLAPES